MKLFNFYVLKRPARGSHLNARNFNENFEIPHFYNESRRNVESVLKFSEEIMKWYLQDGACSTFAQEKIRSGAIIKIIDNNHSTENYYGHKEN